MPWFSRKDKSTKSGRSTPFGGFKQSKAARDCMLQKARVNEETQKDAYDLSSCEVIELPSDTFFQVELHLKTSLNLSNNFLTSLEAGGGFDKLDRIQSLNLSSNCFKHLPETLFPYLCSISRLDLSKNRLRELPSNLGCITTLQCLNVEDNDISELPSSIGDCKFLSYLNIKKNPIKTLPSELGKIGVTLQRLELTSEDISFPNDRVLTSPVEEILRYLASHGGHEFPTSVAVPSHGLMHMKAEFSQGLPTDSAVDNYIQRAQDELDREAKIALEAMEKEDNILRSQAATAISQNDRVAAETLAYMALDDNETRSLLEKLAKERAAQLKEASSEIDREEQIANKMILQLLEDQNREIPSILDKLIQDENDVRKFQQELYNDTVAVDEIIAKDLAGNAEISRFMNNMMRDQAELAKAAMRSMDADDADFRKMALQNDSISQENARIVAQKIAEDEALQRELFISALKARDAQMLQIEADISNVERQLIRMTMADVNDLDLMVKDILSSERAELARMLAMLHDQLIDREKMIAQTLDSIEQQEKDDRNDFWLVRYRQIMQEKPPELIHLEARVSQLVRDVLETASCTDYLTLFARHSILEENDLRYLSVDRLKALGIWSVGEQNRIMASITKHVAPLAVETTREEPSAPAPTTPRKEGSGGIEASSSISRVDAPPIYEEPVVAPSAPTVYETETECCICLDERPNMIFIPCGHVVTCKNCVEPLTECPICRAAITSKVPLAMH